MIINFVNNYKNKALTEFVLNFSKDFLKISSVLMISEFAKSDKTKEIEQILKLKKPKIYKKNKFICKSINCIESIEDENYKTATQKIKHIYKTLSFLVFENNFESLHKYKDIENLDTFVFVNIGEYSENLIFDFLNIIISKSGFNKNIKFIFFTTKHTKENDILFSSLLCKIKKIIFPNMLIIENGIVQKETKMFKSLLDFAKQ